MNIKRAFIALGAMLLSVGSLVAFPQQAQATPHYTPASPDCIAWNLASTTWPQGPTGDVHFFICDGSYVGFANPSPVSIAIRDAGSNQQTTVVKNKLAAAHVGLFVFAFDWQYNQYPHTQIGSILENGYAGTTPSMSGAGGAHPWPAIIILESRCVTPPSGCTNAQYLDYKRIVNHEVGHALDIISGYPSQSSSFTTRLDQDIIDFNLKTNVSWGGTNPNCNAITPNFARLKCALNIPSTYTTAQVRSEIWADCYGSDQPNGTYPGPASVVLSTNFRTGGATPPSTRQRSCTYVNAFVQTP